MDLKFLLMKEETRFWDELILKTAHQKYFNLIASLKLFFCTDFHFWKFIYLPLTETVFCAALSAQNFRLMFHSLLSQPSKTRVLRILCELCIPFKASSRRASHSFLVSFTVYLFINNPRILYEHHKILLWHIFVDRIKVIIVSEYCFLRIFIVLLYILSIVN